MTNSSRDTQFALLENFLCSDDTELGSNFLIGTDDGLISGQMPDSPPLSACADDSWLSSSFDELNSASAKIANTERPVIDQWHQLQSNNNTQEEIQDLFVPQPPPPQQQQQQQAASSSGIVQQQPMLAPAFRHQPPLAPAPVVTTFPNPASFHGGHDAQQPQPNMQIHARSLRQSNAFQKLVASRQEFFQQQEVFFQQQLDIVSDSNAKLEYLTKLYEKYMDSIRRFSSIQKDYIVKGVCSESTGSKIFNEYKQIDAMLKDVDLKLRNLYSGVLLTSCQISRWKQLRIRFNAGYVQLTLLVRELKQFHGLEKPGAPLCQLVLDAPLFPQTFSKSTRHSFHPSLCQVKLIRAAAVDIRKCSPVLGRFMQGDDPVSAHPKIEAQMDTVNWSASVSLKFLAGTDLKVSRLKFWQEVTIYSHATKTQSILNLSSNFSQPFVVLVHPKQFNKAEGLLLQEVAFGKRELVAQSSSSLTAPVQSQSTCSWPKFANWLQHQFILVTKQELSKPQRPLSRNDLAYIHARFFRQAGNALITDTQFSQFWSWYGGTIRQLKYGKHISTLWSQGYIHGFSSRKRLNQLLATEKPSTFIIRFSERHSGLFAISHVPHVMVAVLQAPDASSVLKHFLVQPTDIGKQTLPDFLKSKPQYQRLLRFQPQLKLGVAKPCWIGVEKNEALVSFYSKHLEKQPQPDGYDY